jgi:hypothetical protein
MGCGQQSQASARCRKALSLEIKMSVLGDG